MNDAPTLDLDALNCTHTEINQSVCIIGLSVEDEDGDSPFFSISGTDSVLSVSSSGSVFHTGLDYERYKCKRQW